VRARVGQAALVDGTPHDVFHEDHDYVGSYRAGHREHCEPAPSTPQARRRQQNDKDRPRDRVGQRLNNQADDVCRREERLSQFQRSRYPTVQAGASGLTSEQQTQRDCDCDAQRARSYQRRPGPAWQRRLRAVSPRCHGGR
jgi:hypothetical protein